MQFLPNENLEATQNCILVYVNSFLSHLFYYVRYVEENFFTVLIIFGSYIILCISLYFIVSKSNILTYAQGNIKKKERILFIISHPDDECMFFGPTIIHLTKHKDKNVFLLCLSYGDYYQKGKLRKEELWKSCSILGIPESNIIIQKISSLSDNPNSSWDENVIHNLIISYIETFHFDAVITFDKDGVSGHSNHKSVYYGLANTIARQLFPNYCSVYCLDSVNKFRKYSFIFDLLFSICFSSDFFVLPPSESYLVKTAMKSHETQYIWFRKIYIWISRYAYINTYTLLCANEAMLDIYFRDICDLK